MAGKVMTDEVFYGLRGREIKQTVGSALFGGGVGGGMALFKVGWELCVAGGALAAFGARTICGVANMVRGDKALLTSKS